MNNILMDKNVASMTLQWSSNTLDFWESGHSLNNYKNLYKSQELAVGGNECCVTLITAAAAPTSFGGVKGEVVHWR